MIRDPFHRQIQDRLAGKLDPEIFERCASDLLRGVYPTLVPIRGGSDRGMDGAIADGEGPAFPLVTTTADDVIGNLRRNLRSYVDAGLPRRKAVLATSQVLTQERRINLENTAAELGFNLVQIHEGSNFADLLYHNSKWSKELLGLEGDPPALSVLPRPTRPRLTSELVGRTADLEWLETSEGDVLLAGQPGSGKTFLLAAFAKRSGALFVRTADLGKLAAAIRDLAPTALIVEDAHLAPSLLGDLRQLRQDLRAGFRIIADAWVSHLPDVLKALDLPALRELDLLTRDEIVELIGACGIKGPRLLVREIVDQAGGKPGLAATLCSIAIGGDVDALIRGDALVSEVEVAFKAMVGEDVLPILGAFAIGGDRGMRMADVAAFLEVPIGDLRSRVARLAAGGVLIDAGDDRLVIRPPALRYMLVRDIFFSGALSLDLNALLPAASSAGDTAETLVGAAHRGAAVPEDVLHRLLLAGASDDTWAAYAHLGRLEAEWVMRNHADWRQRIGGALLWAQPALALPALLDAAVGDKRALHSTPSHTLRLISDWVAAVRPGTAAVLERRALLIARTDEWWAHGGDVETAVHAMTMALSPAYSRTESDPGSGMRVMFTYGLVSQEDMEAIEGLWPAVLNRLPEAPTMAWAPVRDLIRTWSYPSMVAHTNLPEEIHARARAFARRLASDVSRIAPDEPGTRRWLRDAAATLDLMVDLDADPTFEILFPQEDLNNWREVAMAQQAAADTLAEQMERMSVEEAAHELVRCEKQSLQLPRAWPRWTWYVCQQLAARSKAPGQWLGIFLSYGVQSDIIEPFARRIIEQADPDAGIPILISECLDDDRYRLTVAGSVLQCVGPDTPMGRRALEQLSGSERTVWTWCLQDRFSIDVLRALLGHPDRSVAGFAAVGIWNADPVKTVPEALAVAWRQAIVDLSADDWHLGQILEDDPIIALEWLLARLDDPDLWRLDDIILRAMSGFSTDDRLAVLSAVTPILPWSTLIEALVGNDVDVFRTLLARRDLENLHLASLHGRPDGAGWTDKARVALTAGIAAKDIADACFGGMMEWSGKESEHWESWRVAFSTLEEDEDAGIREIGASGQIRTATMRDGARRRERDEDVRGR